MIGKFTYEQLLSISTDLRNQTTAIEEVIKDKNLSELEDFVSTVEGYSKYLETVVEMNRDADLALTELKNKKK